MKMLIFSDIHGSLPAARFMADRTRREKPDAVLLLGDILYHGPRNPLPQGYDPKAAAGALSPLKSRIVAIAGNCDSEVDATMLSFPLSSGFSWIMTDGLRIFATHGHRHTPDALPPLEEGDIFLFGHTHVPMAATTSKGIHLCNPGSLSLPKEGHPPCYGMFEKGLFSVFTDQDELYLQLDCV